MDPIENARFLGWTGNPSMRARVWYVNGDTVLAEIEQTPKGDLRWCWFCGDWKRAANLREAKEAVVFEHIKRINAQRKKEG